MAQYLWDTLAANLQPDKEKKVFGQAMRRFRDLDALISAVQVSPRPFSPAGWNLVKIRMAALALHKARPFLYALFWTKGVDDIWKNRGVLYFDLGLLDRAVQDVSVSQPEVAASAILIVLPLTSLSQDLRIGYQSRWCIKTTSIADQLCRFQSTDMGSRQPVRYPTDLGGVGGGKRGQARAE